MASNKKIDELGGYNLVRSMQIYDSFHDFKSFPNVKLPDGHKNEDLQIRALCEGYFMDGKGNLYQNTKLKDHLRGYKDHPIIQIDTTTVYSNIANQINEKWYTNRFIEFVFKFQSLYKNNGSDDRERYLDHGTALILRNILTTLFPRSSGQGVLLDRLVCIIDTSVLSFPALFYNDEGHTNSDFMHLIDESNRWDMASTKWNDEQRSTCSCYNSDFNPSSEYVYIAPPGAKVTRMKIRYNNFQQNLFSTPLWKIIDDKKENFMGYSYYIVKLSEITGFAKLCDVPTFSDIGIKLASDEDDCCSSIAILYNKTSTSNDKAVLLKKTVDTGKDAISVQKISDMMGNQPENTEGRNAVINMLKTIGITDIGNQYNLFLYDLKRSGDWGQVNSVIQSNKNFVFVTIDRLAYMYAVLNNVPSILVSSMMDVPGAVKKEEEVNESRHNAYSLKCYIPSIGTISNPDQMKKTLVDRIQISEIDGYLTNTVKNVESFIEYCIRLKSESSKPQQRYNTMKYKGYDNLLDYISTGLVVDTLQKYISEISTKISNFKTVFENPSSTLDDKYDILIKTLRVKDEYYYRENVVPVYTYCYLIKSSSRRFTISIPDREKFMNYVEGFIQIVRKLDTYISSVDILIDDTMRDQLDKYFSDIMKELSQYKFTINGGSTEVEMLQPMTQGLQPIKKENHIYKPGRLLNNPKRAIITTDVDIAIKSEFIHGTKSDFSNLYKVALMIYTGLFQSEWDIENSKNIISQFWDIDLSRPQRTNSKENLTEIDLINNIIYQISNKSPKVNARISSIYGDLSRYISYINLIKDENDNIEYTKMFLTVIMEYASIYLMKYESVESAQSYISTDEPMKSRSSHKRRSRSGKSKDNSAMHTIDRDDYNYNGRKKVRRGGNSKRVIRRFSKKRKTSMKK
jgi:hypothetical protein